MILSKARFSYGVQTLPALSSTVCAFQNETRAFAGAPERAGPNAAAACWERQTKQTKPNA